MLLILTSVNSEVTFGMVSRTTPTV